MLFALLLLQADPVAAFDLELKAANSATAVLQKRCAEPILARVDIDAFKPATPTIRADLRAGPAERTLYRSVKLMCGERVFSHAENWYLPSRLTAAMNHALLTTDTPYGAAIRDLAPTRKTLGSERPAPADGVLRHRAVVLRADGEPLALVVETYTEDAAKAH